jgi:cell division protein ZipA
MSDIWLLRIGIIVAGVLLMVAIWYFGRPRRAPQGTRVESRGRSEAGRMEPTLGAQLEQELAQGGHAGEGHADEETVQSELDLLDSAIGAVQPNSELGKRTSEDFDKIVTLYIAARAGRVLKGTDIVVAAEKAGLTYGHMNVFHRLVQGHPEQGPVFSVANVRKPGSFEMSEIQTLETPAIAFFLTLPAPVPALDAWEMMQPAAERMAELLDGVVLDESRNALGRQRIQHLREEMRAYDRQREGVAVKPGRW